MLLDDGVLYSSTASVAGSGAPQTLPSGVRTRPHKCVQHEYNVVIHVGDMNDHRCAARIRSSCNCNKKVEESMGSIDIA